MFYCLIRIFLVHRVFVSPLWDEGLFLFYNVVILVEMKGFLKLPQIYNYCW